MVPRYAVISCAGAGPLSDHRLRCMFGNSGASYLVGAFVPTTEENGSDVVVAKSIALRTPWRVFIAPFPCSSSPNHDHFVGSWFGGGLRPPLDLEFPWGAYTEKDASSVGAATSRPQVCAMVCAVRRGAQCAPAVHRPRCMFVNSGADYLVEASGLIY